MNILPQKPHTHQNTQNVARSTKINNPLCHEDILLPDTPVQASPFSGELFLPQLHQAEAATFSPLRSPRGWPRMTEVNPGEILPWDFYNGTRDRKSPLGAESTKCNSGTISSLPCQL